MVDETTIKLPIPPEVKDASGVARIAVINYKAESALTREAFDAQAMATVSFFNSLGEKIKGRTKGSSLPLPRQQHIELAFSFMKKQTEMNVTGSPAAKCVFYDLQRLKWSPQGCQINEAETGKPSQSAKNVHCVQKKLSKVRPNMNFRAQNEKHRNIAKEQKGKRWSIFG